MECTIANRNLKVSIDSLGAELRSIRTDDGHEYLWQGDPASWNRRSPVLFPIIGGLAHDYYVMDGRRYPMGSHGFARDMEFSLVEESGSSCAFVVSDDVKTREIYPFAFELGITYSLSESSLTVGYHLRNRNERKMWFSIGGHPGFNCPMEPGLRFEDYRLEFEKPETIDRMLKGERNLSGVTESFLENQRTVPLTHDMFSRGAVILQGLKSESVAIRSTRGTRSVKVAFAGFSYLGIWSWAGKADFVCIEPWYGVDSTEGDPPEIEAKAGIRYIDPEETFECGFSVMIT